MILNYYIKKIIEIIILTWDLNAGKFGSCGKLVNNQETSAFDSITFSISIILSSVEFKSNFKPF